MVTRVDKTGPPHLPVSHCSRSPLARQADVPMENIDMEDSNCAMWVFSLRGPQRDLRSSEMPVHSVAVSRASCGRRRKRSGCWPRSSRRWRSRWSGSQGSDRLYMNFDYALSDEAGEITRPRIRTERRRQGHGQRDRGADLLRPEGHGRARHAAVAEFFRQLKMESRALSAQALLDNNYYPGDEQASGGRWMETFEVERITRRRAWAFAAGSLFGGRDTAQVEPWRITGGGDPIETWEPLSSPRTPRLFLPGARCA